MLGTKQNFLVEPFGPSVSVDDGILSRAWVARKDPTPSPSKVVLKLRHSDWHVLEDSIGVLKFIQGQVLQTEPDFLLDCTATHTAIVSTAALSQGTCISLVELFSGGFAGWSQAAYVLHRAKVPIHVSWTLDVAAECEPMLQVQCPELHCVSAPGDLAEILSDTPEQVHLCANIEHDWWLSAFSSRPAHIVTLSPPCQPWSEAAAGPGLASSDGQLMLRAADVLGAIETPVVLLEQVAGFARHPHADIVIRAWQEVGYVVHWRAMLDLLDVLPSSRQRIIYVLRHRRCHGPSPLQGHRWAQVCRHNLATAQVLMDLPVDMLQPLILSQELEQIYFDPWFLPPTRSGSVHRQSPKQFRVRTAAHSAGCFLAQYQFQHELSEHQLSSKGLLGFLLLHQGVVRFFSGAEVAAIHGAVKPILLEQDRRCQMKLLGNAIAVPQAVAGLSFACQALGVTGVPEPAAAVALSLRERITNTNALFLPVGSDWVLCRKDQVESVLGSAVFRAKGTAFPTAPSDLVPLTFHCAQEQVVIHAPAGLPALRVFRHLGIAHVAASLPDHQFDRLEPIDLQVDQLPALGLYGFQTDNPHPDGLCTVLASSGAYVIDTKSPRMWPQLLNIFDSLSATEEDLQCWSLEGRKLQFAEDFGQCMIATTIDRDAPELPMSLLGPMLGRLRTSQLEDGVNIRCPVPDATALWLGFPFHLVLALGWDTRVLHFPPEPPTPMTLSLQPVESRIHLQPSLLPYQLRHWFLRASLQALANPDVQGPSIDVEIQVETRTIWCGSLPAQLTVHGLEQMWQAASGAAGIVPGVRVFSGPHPLQLHLSLEDIKEKASLRVMRRTGRLLMTFHPHCAGGGAKDEGKHWAQTKAASLCLSQGFDLRTTTAYVDAISQKGSANRILQALQATSEDSRWAQLSAYARELDITVPQPTSLVARAEARARRNQTKRKPGIMPVPKASEVSVSPGFFVNEDGTDAQVLSNIRPGATGVWLVDGDQAADALNTLTGVQPDELGVLVLGHVCPDPANCSKRLSFPASSRSGGSKLLLAGCLHNVGGKAIGTSKQADYKVDLPDILCCTFVAYSDEFSPDRWSQLVQSPVRCMLAAFEETQTAKAVTAPWGRIFKASGKPSPPNLADQVSFQARVTAQECDQLLLASGHNSIYITPRKLDHSLVSGYAIIWLGPSRPEALKAALQIQDQRGLVRAKGRFGLRVPEARHDAIYAQLRPGQPVPAKIAVSSLFRIGPIPTEADASALCTRANKFGWPIRAIKALGPCHWLIGSAKHPPLAWPLFNGQTVLINPVQQRAPTAPIVQSGTFAPSHASASTPSHAKVTGPPTHEHPWLLSDPWSAAQSQASTPARTVSSTLSAPSPAVARSVTGPTEQRFQQQDARIQALEQGLRDLRLQHEQSHDELIQQQAADREATQRTTTGLQEQISSVGTDLTRQLQASSDALQQAQTLQQLQMQSSLDELKALFLENREVRAGKKAKKDTENDENLYLYARQVGAVLFNPRFEGAKGDMAWRHCGRPVAAIRALSTGVVARAPIAFSISVFCGRPFACPTVSHLPGAGDCILHLGTVLLPRIVFRRVRNHDHLKGCRVGEAANPGPLCQQSLTSLWGAPSSPLRPHAATPGASPPSGPAPPSNTSEASVTEPVAGFTPLRLAVVNPTAILNKDRDLLAMQQDVLVLSETSATERAQRVFSSKVRPHGYHMVWSKPVAPHVSARADTTSLRGHAAGVALLSNKPARTAFAPLPATVKESSRLLEAHLRIGQSELRIFVMYGYPANYHDSGARNGQLLRTVLSRVQSCRIPAIIGGDFNTPVCAAPEFAELQHLGYVEAFQHWQQREGIELPPTCKNATRNDTLLIPAELLPCLHSLQVARDLHAFDAHAPLLAEFRLPGITTGPRGWRMPRTWAPLLPDTADLEAAYVAVRPRLAAQLDSCQTTDDLDHAFQSWADNVETSVDTTLRKCHASDPLDCPVGRLPRAARGRCRYRPLQCKAMPRSAPAARTGDYQPPEEAVTVVSRAKVKQVRRLQTFLHGLLKLAARPTSATELQLQLRQEWHAISKARGYAPSFALWLLKCPAFVSYWRDLPPIEWTRDVLQYVQFDADATVRQEAAYRAKLARLQVHQDAQHCHSRGGFKNLRPHPRPPFTSIPHCENQKAELVRMDSPFVGLYRVPLPDFVRIGPPTFFEDTAVQVIGKVVTPTDDCFLQVRVDAEVGPAQTRLIQHSCASTPRELQRVFVEYWSAIWLRDKGDVRTDPNRWRTFLSSLPDAPETARELHIDLSDGRLWQKQIRRLRNGRATGYCGFSPEELKRLPPTAVDDLACLFKKISSCGFPRHLAQATVHVLAKVDTPQNIGQGRPITVYATIYRLWASVAAKAILRHWATWLPASVRGCVPGRGAREVSLAIEIMIEESLLHGRPLGGFSLDVVKRFNQLPRLPLRHLLGHLGVPADILEIWFQFLDVNTRFVCFHGQLGPPTPSTTGMPEGDPLSVVAQIAVCWALVARPLPPSCTPWTYVDNLSWLADNGPDLRFLLEDAVAFCQSLCLPIDWGKSFCWGTTPALRKFWKGLGLPASPPFGQLKLVKDAKDLGVHFRFSRNQGLGTAAARLSDGLKRLSNLQRQHRPLLDAAHLIQSGVWPAALYGMEGHVPPAAKLDQLRSAAAKAMLGDRSSMSPHLALCCLTPQVSDPAVFLLNQCLQALRRLLIVLPELGERWLQCSCALAHQDHRVIGPATALAKMLRDHQWTIQSSGVLKGPGHWHIHIRLLLHRPSGELARVPGLRTLRAALVIEMA
ncbi:unnamed protein product [Symbiodinium sp. CCMP2592]|nr:unnamed protein product [Symbiodinium sp. CCMP2592]